MSLQALFGLSIVLSFVAFGLVTKLYVWPRLRTMERNDALLILVVSNTFRFIGLSFLVPGVVSPSLPYAFAGPGAYGDLMTIGLAIASTIALARRTSWATWLVWVFNMWGAADFLYAYYNGIRLQFDLGMLGAAFYIPTVIVPIYLVIHGLIFWLLIRPWQSNHLSKEGAKS